MAESILVDDLKDFNYYVNKVPLYLQKDEKFLTHFKIWYDFLIGQEDVSTDGLVGAGDTLLDLFNIYDEDYLTKVDKYGSFFLDYLAGIFNIRRNFKVKYMENGSQVTKAVSLDNKDLLLFIKSRIIRNYSNGTYEQMKKFYEDNGLRVILVWASSTGQATVNSYLLDYNKEAADNYSENIDALFKAGLLTIQSMGILYNHSSQTLENIGIWDNSGSLWSGEGEGETYKAEWII